jgi:hypothetical protein
MPWTAGGPMGFGARHNHSLTNAQSAHAALQANAILKKTGDEGLAIAVANKHAKRADGGATEAYQSPIQQQALGSFNAMTPEQLQEAVLRMKGSPQGALAAQVLARKRVMTADPGPASGPPQQYAIGGSLQAKGGVHISERGIAPPRGLLHTAGPGRTDNLNIHPHADSYVLPADVVSGLGEGNSLAGAKAMDLALHTGPAGIPLPAAPRHGMGIPKPPSGKGFGLAAGGKEPPKVPIVAAGGEYVISPEQCSVIGGGDIKRGHRILDAFVLHVRKRTIKDLSKLKGPVKS